MRSPVGAERKRTSEEFEFKIATVEGKKLTLVFDTIICDSGVVEVELPEGVSYKVAVYSDKYWPAIQKVNNDDEIQTIFISQITGCCVLRIKRV